MLSTDFINYLFHGLDLIYYYSEDFNFCCTNITYEKFFENIIVDNYDYNFHALWHLSMILSDNMLLWSVLLDDYINVKFTNIPNFNEWFVFTNDLFDSSSMYYDFPDYIYIYKSFIFDWFYYNSSNLINIGDLYYDMEDVFVVPVIFINFWLLFLFLLIFISLYFTYYNNSSDEDKLIDHDYLISSSTFEAEEEISSWDDMILALIILVFIFLWYFGINTLFSLVKTPEFYLSLYIFPVLYYLIMLIPLFLAYDFGIYFVSYLRGKGDSTISLVELMYDYIAFASFYIRLVVQNVRLLLMIFTFASFHEIIMIHEVNKSFIIGDEFFLEDSLKDSFSYTRLCFFMLGQISTHIIYFFYELFHLLFVITAQFIAFHAMVFWLFLFLYTMFSVELHEKFFLKKRIEWNKSNEKYFIFRKKFIIK